MARPAKVSPSIKPSAPLRDLSEQDAGLAMDIPPVQAPVMVRRLADREWQIEIAGIATDVGHDPSNSDVHVIRLLDQAPLVSQGVLKSDHAFALHSHALKAMGMGRFDYAALTSQEISGGSFDGIQPSTAEGAMRVGLMSEPNVNDPTVHDFVGLGHGLIKNLSCEISGEYLTVGGTYLTRSDLLTAITLGKALRFREVTVTCVYDIYRPPRSAPLKCGQMSVTHTFTSAGVQCHSRWKVGRALGYSAGNAPLSEGDVITGATSGATAELVVVPDSDTTGTWAGGDRAGLLFVKDASGAFQDGEVITVGGQNRASVSGTLGPALSMQNSYGNMAPCTVVNRIKPRGLPAIEIGSQDGSQRPSDAVDGVGNGAIWNDGASRIAHWHSRAPEVLFEMILQKWDGSDWVEAPCPIDPPGDFSEATTSVLFAQDRIEGLRKTYPNARSGTAPQLWEGVFDASALMAFRIGTPL
ncbi:MAG: hypothetical protein ABJL67_15895 [Sulfitobacter sp.]